MLPYRYDHTLRVRYCETDQMGIVWHGNYIQYFEEARTEAFRATGAGSYDEMEKLGIMMPVVHLALDYYASAHFDDVLTCRVIVKDPPSARMTFHYEIMNESGTLLCKGVTVLAFMNAHNHRPCKPPHNIRAFFQLSPDC